MNTVLYCCLCIAVTVVNSQDTAWINNIFNGLKDKVKSLDDKISNVESQARRALEQASAPRQGCQSGRTGQHAAPAPKWPYSTYISFNPPFDTTPALTFGTYLLDAGYDANLRISTEVEGLSKNGFTLNIKTWANSVLYGGRISWMACPTSI